MTKHGLGEVQSNAVKSLSLRLVDSDGEGGLYGKLGAAKLDWKGDVVVRVHGGDTWKKCAVSPVDTDHDLSLYEHLSQMSNNKARPIT